VNRLKTEMEGVQGNMRQHLPLYLRMKETLLAQIQDGRLKPGDLLPSERELGTQYGVSSITVRRALSELVKEGHVIRQVGVGSFVKSAHRQTRLGLVVFGFDENDWRRNRDIFGDLVGGITSAAWEGDAVFSLIRTSCDTHVGRFLESLIGENAYDGLILRTAGDFSRADLAPLLRERVPFVLVKRNVEGLGVNSVVVDEFRGGLLATQHLISLGHQRIAFVGPTGVSVAKQRYLGYQQALREANLVADSGLVQVVPSFTQADGYSGTQRVLEHHPTAIFASADVLAEGCFEACTEAGLQIPADISVVGHDDYSAALRVRPQLTTVRISYYDLGLRSAKMLLEIIGSCLSSPMHEVLTPTLVVRESSGPVRAVANRR